MMTAVQQGDLYLSPGRGGGGLGDPLERPPERVADDVSSGHLLERLERTAYRVDDRDAARAERLERARPTREWWAEQRQRILDGGLIEPIQVMLAESMRLGPEFAAEYRGFWDLPEDFDFDVVTPTIEVQRAAPGKITPAESVAAVLGQSRCFVPAEGLDRVPVASEMTKELLADLHDEKLSRRAVKAIQSGIKDPDRFDKWIELLSERVGWDERIVLPYGEAMYIVKRADDGAYVIKTEAGAELGPWDENWKMSAQIFVRDSDELYEEVYPKLGHPDGAWQELREYYCPLSGRLLEIEAYPPGYPVVHEYLPDLRGFYEGWLGRELP